jgi:hypothetical protein
VEGEGSRSWLEEVAQMSGLDVMCLAWRFF